MQPLELRRLPDPRPGDGSLLGILDITGGDQIVVPQTMAMVRAAARMAETELAHLRLTARTAAERTAQPRGLALRLEALGRTEALLGIDDGSGRRLDAAAAPRHSEILLLLASAPRGLSGDELAVLLYEEDNTASTLRAELNRLRNLLGDDLLASRPYRLVGEVAGDWLGVRGEGARPATWPARCGPTAARCCRARPRRAWSGSARRSPPRLRSAVLRSGVPDLMSTWTRSSWGSDDYEMWVAQRDAVGARSPLLPLVLGQIARLDRELA